jgi:hypothetical protein
MIASKDDLEQGSPLLADGDGSLSTLALLSLVAGAPAGIVGATFRLTLAQADGVRNVSITRGLMAGRFSASRLFSQAAPRRPPLPRTAATPIEASRKDA